MDLAANDAAEEISAADDSELNSDVEPGLEDMPSMDDTTELKAAPVADTA